MCASPRRSICALAETSAIPRVSRRFTAVALVSLRKLLALPLNFSVALGMSNLGRESVPTHRIKLHRASLVCFICCGFREINRLEELFQLSRCQIPPHTHRYARHGDWPDTMSAKLHNLNVDLVHHLPHHVEH